MNGKNENIIQMLELLAASMQPRRIIFLTGSGVRTLDATPLPSSISDEWSSSWPPDGWWLLNPGVDSDNNDATDDVDDDDGDDSLRWPMSLPSPLLSPRPFVPIDDIMMIIKKKKSKKVRANRTVTI